MDSHRRDSKQAEALGSAHEKPEQAPQNFTDTAADDPSLQAADASEPSKRRASVLQRLKHPLHKEKKDAGEEKKESISASGPYIFAFDPDTGTRRLMKNPHWPEEDSWKREKDKPTVPGGAGYVI
ncbi:hypothetical protein KC343_g16408 [Hortaea werneckii]|nr:hypothetical protein KC323_g8592 [Hortaea werneckii]KAI6856282.1 hypothetical protein KC338_g8529 [Hortaea werneckii]KAI7136778.1 hypothetical protein KC352_g30413 [Hortaea werneckii]KAI7345108.1 hypothetical protein KC320_g8511 [Hortaea werneckii]KAI7558896.1 hypothetical protein KC317_g10709 [Hortaea werneckii]